MSKRKDYQFSKPAPGMEGKVFWTSLEAKADPVAYQERAKAEFVDGVSGSDTVSSESLRMKRRTFVGIAGAAGALLGLEGCIRRPEDKILPFTRQPEYVLPGISLHYATTARIAGDSIGLLVETHEGRPTKVEGNPNHPTSLGATDGYAQAAVLDLYDPDRSRFPASVKDKAFTDSTFAEVDKGLTAIADAAAKNGGAKLRVLVQSSSSPTFARVEKAFLAKYPQAKVYTYEPISALNTKLGLQQAFGISAEPAYSFRRARTVLALDSDFLGSEPGSVRNAREFADGRRLGSPRDSMSRLYVVEPGFTSTGASADNRLRLAARDVGSYLKALAAELGVGLTDSEGANFESLRSGVTGAKAPAGVPESWIKAVAKELLAAKGQSLIVVGSRQPAAVHALAFALNHALGNVGRTLVFTPSVDGAKAVGPLDEITALAGELQAGAVDTLVILGGNPALDAPANLKFAELIGKAATKVHFSSYRDETSHLVDLHVPRAHDFESWGDHRSFEGSISIQQPLIAPLHGGRSDIEVLAKLAGIEWWRGYPLVRTTFREAFGAGSFEALWKSALHLGVARELTVAPIGSVSLDGAAVGDAIKQIADAKTALGASNLEVNFVPDPGLYDGRHANNPWMLEVPHPLSCVTWDNAAYVSPNTAKELGIANYDLITVKDASGATVDIVTWVLPGQAEHTITLNLGWGRTVAGRYGNGAGFNVYPLRSAAAFGFGDGFSVSKTGGRYPVSVTQETHSMEGRPIAIDTTLEEYRKNPDFAEFRSPTLSTLPLWQEVEYKGHRWGMAIDLSACTGCNSCLIACQAENNVASVGKEQVARGRDMFWLRLDRYFVGTDESNPQIAFQPVGCQHCEEAPCENVCPVNATAHSPEGLNDMAYNRCIGTRYCMNNCPYKVRRFNFLDFTGQVPETRRMQYNPNVSVRMRGVMEKCSYCVQRIQEAKITARREQRQLRDGDVKVACQTACASGCITFGDLNDPNSKVAKAVKLDRQYSLLPDLGVQPRTSFLAKIRNPNPEIQG
ncbi:MAG TPA: 4Fe-4S dicluster domain-containing protein [Polyangiales bacterium]|nr:4Fe-4S dicluster domain-containing protein [Polyangiales bacterium]